MPMAKHDESDKKKRCQCSTKATIKTTYDRDLVAYHCSELCRQHWMKTNRVSIIKGIVRDVAGFAAESA